MTRILFFLLVSISCFGQEMYPGESTCFGVPNNDSNFSTPSLKADKIYLEQITVTYCSPIGPETINLDSLFIRDNTNPAYASTDYYNQDANDQINEALRNFIASNNPSWGDQDDVGVIFNSRLKDPPSLSGNACDVNIDGTSGMHSFRVVIAWEFLNKNWRQGDNGGGKKILQISFKLQFEKGGITTEYVAIAAGLSCSLPGNPSAPQYNSSCTTLWGFSGNRSSMYGYFTERSVPKLWRQSRNDWRFNNAGFWAGQVPYTGFLTDARRRCITFASFSCSDLSQAVQDTIADRIIAAGVEGTCLPLCGSCQDYVMPWLEVLPGTLYPNVSNGSIKLINPNPTMAGTYEIFKNGVSQGTGALPNTSITMESSWTYANTTTEGWAIRLYRTGCDTLIFGFDPGSFNYTVSVSWQPVFDPWTKIALQFNPGKCGATKSASYVNKMQIPTVVQTLTFTGAGATLVTTPDIDMNANRSICDNHDTYDGTGSNFRTIILSRLGVPVDLNVKFFMQKLNCPCPTKNRYIVFRSNWNPVPKKAALQALGWTVLP